MSATGLRFGLVVGMIAVGLLPRAVPSAVAQSSAASDGVSQPGPPRFVHRFDIPFSGPGMPLTVIHDALDRPFLYVASKDAGLRIYKLESSPRLVRSIPIAKLGSMHVMSLAQVGRRLYLALGNHWGQGEGVGLAVIDVSEPDAASVAGRWNDPTAKEGGGAVAVDGSTAYLAGMGDGLIVLDVGNPAAIRVSGRIKPDLAFPDARPDPRKINARGLALRNNLVFLCYDAGGLRVIDVADPGKPVEVGRFSNPAMNGRPRAYNNVALDGSLAYATVDYVGMEVLDISDPGAIELVSWWNPWNPSLNGFRWFSSPGHTNEVVYDQATKTVLISAGRTDLVAVDVSDPENPRQVGSIGEVDDTKATWGVSKYGDQIYLSYIRTLGVPFRADWPGVRIFEVRP